MHNLDIGRKMEYDIDRGKRASRGQDIKGNKRSGPKCFRGKLCMDLPWYYWRNEYNNLLCKWKPSWPLTTCMHRNNDDFVQNEN